MKFTIFVGLVDCIQFKLIGLKAELLVVWWQIISFPLNGIVRNWKISVSRYCYNVYYEFDFFLYCG